MTGNIEYRGNGSFRLRASEGTGKDRKILRKLVKYDGVVDEEKIKKKEYPRVIEKELAKFIAELENNNYLVGKANVTLSSFVEIWKKNHADELEPKTVQRYMEMLDMRILPVLGHVKLEKLQPMHLLDFYKNLSETGIRKDKIVILTDEFLKIIEERKLKQTELSAVTGVGVRTIQQLKKSKRVSGNTFDKICKALEITPNQSLYSTEEKDGLSQRTISHHHKLISTILEKAVKWQYLLNNPAKRIDPPKVVRKETLHYDEIDAENLIESIKEEPLKYQLAIILTLYTGLREGELMGLEWDDIDLEEKTLRVRQASQYIPSTSKYVEQTGVFIKNPKTENSKRIISLSDEVIPLIKKYKAWQNEEILKSGDLWVGGKIGENEEKNPDYVFTQKSGEPMHPYTVTKWFKNFIKRKQLPNLSFHGLRHTHATLLIGEKVDIKTVSSRLGHSNASTTLNIYTHNLKSKDRDAADKIGKLFKNKNALEDSEAKEQA